MKIREIVKQPESRMLEFKRELPKNRQNLLKTVVAFANGAGGNIYIGVSNDRSVVGVKEDSFDLEEKLSSMIYDSISPIPNVFYQTVCLDDNIIFIIRVLPGINKPYYLKKYGLINTVLKRLKQLEEKGLINKQGGGSRVKYST